MRGWPRSWEQASPWHEIVAVGDGTVRLKRRAPMMQESVTRSVVFLWGRRKTRSGGYETGPIGTAFLVQVMQGAEQFLYLVTCAHVLCDQPNDGNDVECAFRTDSGFLVRARNKGQWHYPSDPELDYAVAPFNDLVIPPGGDVSPSTQVSLPALSLVDDVVASPFDQVELGTPILYVGLLEPFEDMALVGVPMVRSGTIGRMGQPKLSMSVAGNYYEYTGHLIDCRTYMGFSGSPVFVDFHYLAVRETDQKVTIFHSIKLWGMLTGHLRDRSADVGSLAGTLGVGMVLPFETFQTFIEHDEGLMTDRRKRHEATLADKAEPAFVGDSFAQEPPSDSYTGEAFLSDLRKVTRPEAPHDREA
jgi:Trypsin-like peptidase domain